jgi:hypothetical protein
MMQVNRDTNGDVSVHYTEGACSIQLRAAAAAVSFTDAYANPDATIATPAEPATPIASATAADAELVETNDTVDVAAAPDNAQPFKCPACGATYSQEVVCDNQHPAEQTLPTAAVLAGAAPGEVEVAAPPAAEPETAPDTTAGDTTASDAATTTSTSDGDAAVVPPAPPAWPA